MSKCVCVCVWKKFYILSFFRASFDLSGNVKYGNGKSGASFLFNTVKADYIQHAFPSGLVNLVQFCRRKVLTWFTSGMS